MRLLVTRPEPEAVATAAALRALGHEALVEPLLEIALLDPPGPLPAPAALIVTSRNGIRALSHWPAAALWQEAPIFVTGTATAEAAASAGFTDVRPGTGDVAGLRERIAAEIAPGGGPLLYIAGRDRAGDLDGDLTVLGHDVRLVEAYSAEARPALDATVTAALRQGTIDGALFYSPRTASVFVDLVTAAGLADAASGLRLFALSEAVAAPLRRLRGGRIAVAARPEAASLLALLGDDPRPGVTGR